MCLHIRAIYRRMLIDMEGEGGGFLGLSASTLAVLILVVLVALYAAYYFYYGGPTVPLPSYRSGFKDVNEAKKEGFFGGAARGTGAPDCLHTSAEAGELIGMFQGRNSVFEEGSDDLRELTQIASKLSCFKKDLVSPSHIVEATRYQKFVTMHDIEPIAETTGRCFAKTISPRDLELAFDKWNSRGELLIRRLCTSYRLNPSDVNKAQALFRSLIRDIKDIARGACLQGEPTIAGKPGPREAHPFEDAKYETLGEYTGYY